MHGIEKRVLEGLNGVNTLIDKKERVLQDKIDKNKTILDASTKEIDSTIKLFKDFTKRELDRMNDEVSS